MGQRATKSKPTWTDLKTRLAEFDRASVLGVEGTGWDIGHAVRFLLSDHARYITGQTLVVDGGATLVGPSRSPDPSR